jgi:hypothetical protein
MKLTLTKLLKQITPLPWLLVTATDGDKWIGTEEGDGCWVWTGCIDLVLRF